MDKTKLISDYLSGMHIDLICKKHNTSRTTLYNKLKKQGVDKAMRPKLNRNSIETDRQLAVISLYESGEKPRSISKIMKMGGSVVYRILRENGHNNFQTYTLNENCFSEINEHSMYFAGLIMADGCITKTAGGKPNLYLDSSDKDILEKFVLFLGSQPERIHKRKRDNLHRVNVSNITIAQDLEKLGITPRKSYTAEIPNKFVTNRHYWRGLIDGDGWYNWNNRNTAQVGIGSASIRLIEQFVEFLDYYGLYKNNQIYKRKDTANPFYSYVVRGAEAFDLIDILYFDSSVHMDRKREKAMEFMYNRNRW